MRYATGEVVKVGDEIDLGNDGKGVVVCDIDHNIGSIEFPIVQWEYLKKGVIVKTYRIGLVHYENFDAFVCLLSRRKRTKNQG